MELEETDNRYKECVDGSCKVPLENPVPLAEGSLCPVCRKGKLEYDGMLILRCAECGYRAESGCFT